MSGFFYRIKALYSSMNQVQIMELSEMQIKRDHLRKKKMKKKRMMMKKKRKRRTRRQLFHLSYQ